MKVRMYRTYMFKDKDPVIDHLRTAMNGHKWSKVSTDSGVSVGTLSNWFVGETKRPQFATVAAVARSLGPEGVTAITRALSNGTGRKKK